MRKVTIALASCGGAIALGLVLMALGTQAVLDDVVQASDTINIDNDLRIDVVMDPIGDNAPVGVFAVQVLDTIDADITAHVLDPFGTTIASAKITENSVEGQFDVDVEGTYSLFIKNDQYDGIMVFGAIGPLPDIGSKALAFIPFYMLLAGIMGMAGLGIYGIVSMKKMRRN